MSSATYDEKETDGPDDLHRQLASVERLPPDMMLLKMENESIMAIARTMPRDPMKIVGQLKQLIDAYPAAADEAIYSKPVGTVVRVTCGDCGIAYEVVKVDKDTICPDCNSAKRGECRNVKKFAEGLSIRAAESIRSIFGYTRLDTKCSAVQSDGSVKLTGIIVDYAAGNITSDERIVTPYYKSRGGQMVKTPEDRFLAMTVKAEKSKLRRDVILDNTPGIIKAMFRDHCEQKLLELVTPEVIEQKILPAFLEYGITAENLEKIVGRPRGSGWRTEDRLLLRNILSALKNEETTRAELLSGLDVEHGPGNGGPVKGSDLQNPREGVSNGTKTATEAPAKESAQEAAPAAAQAPAKPGHKPRTWSSDLKPDDPLMANDFIPALQAADTVAHVGMLLTRCRENNEIPAGQEDRAAYFATCRKDDIRAAQKPGKKPEQQNLIDKGEQA